MSIGASYTGSDGIGRTFEIDGIPAIGTMAHSMLSMSMQPPSISFPEIPQRRTMPIRDMAQDMDDGKVRMGLGDVPGFLETKISPNGGLIVNGGSLSVKGYENGLGSPGCVLGNAGGEVGFFGLDKIDCIHGETKEFVEEVSVEAVPKERLPGQKLIFKKKESKLKRSSQGRITDIKSGSFNTIFEFPIPYNMYGIRFGYEYDENDHNKRHPIGIKWVATGDEFGLATYDGEETIDGKTYGHFKVNDNLKNESEAPVKVFSGEILGGGKYCVKPTFNNSGILQSLAFGSQSELEAENQVGVKVVNTQIGCPYNS